MAIFAWWRPRITQESTPLRGVDSVIPIMTSLIMSRVFGRALLGNGFGAVIQKPLQGENDEGSIAVYFLLFGREISDLAR